MVSPFFPNREAVVSTALLFISEERREEKKEIGSCGVCLCWNFQFPFSFSSFIVYGDKRSPPCGWRSSVDLSFTACSAGSSTAPTTFWSSTPLILILFSPSPIGTTFTLSTFFFYFSWFSNKFSKKKKSDTFYYRDFSRACFWAELDCASIRLSKFVWFHGDGELNS